MSLNECLPGPPGQAGRRGPFGQYGILGSCNLKVSVVVEVLKPILPLKKQNLLVMYTGPYLVPHPPSVEVYPVINRSWDFREEEVCRRNGRIMVNVTGIKRNSKPTRKDFTTV